MPVSGETPRASGISTDARRKEMGWREDYEKEHAELKAELGSLIVGEGIKPLEERFFKNFGCINFRNADFFHELKLARMFHLWHS